MKITEFKNLKFWATKSPVTEAFDKPNQLDWDKDDFENHHAFSLLGDGSPLHIKFELSDREGNGWHVVFNRNFKYLITGQGYQQQVFATVLAAVKQFVEKYKPRFIEFSANKDVGTGQKAQSRANLYNSLVNRYAGAWGYQAHIDDQEDEVVYKLTRINQPVSESNNTPTSGKTDLGYTWKFEPGREVPFKTDVAANTFVRVKDPAGKTVAGVWADVAGDSLEIEYSQVFDEELRGRGLYTDLLKSLSDHYAVTSDTDTNNAAAGIYRRLGADYDAGQARHTLRKKGVAEGKVKLYTDPGYFGAEIDDAGFDNLPIINISANQLVGFEPDSKMNQPKSRANVEKIVAGLKQGAKLPPLLVRKYKNGYQVLDGHHRFWAYKLLGVKSIPSRIVPDEDIEEISKQSVEEGTLNEFDYNKHVKMLKSYMKKLGYSYVGHGTDAHVFAKEEGSVIKVLIPRSGDISTAKNPFLAFLNYCTKNAGNPHLPKFIETTKQPIQLGSEKFDQVVMERLQEVDPEYENMLVSMVDSIEDGTPLDPQYQPYIKFYQTLKSVMLTGRKLGFENDIITFQSVNIMQRGDTLVIIDPWTGSGRLAEGTLNEIDFSSSLGNLALTDKEIISNSSKDGSIGSRPVFFFQNGSDSLYFFIDNSKIDALIYLHGDRLLGMKNFSNNNGLIYNLFHYVLNIKDKKIHLASVDKLTPDGLQWIIKQIKHPTGFSILDQQGTNVLDPKALYDEWELARTTGKPGPTSIFISKSTISKKIRENENRLMPMDIFGATLIESTDHKNFIPNFINNKQGVAEDEHESQLRPRAVDSMKSMVDVGGIQLNVAIDGAEVSIRPIVDGYQAGYAVFDRDGSTLVPFDLAIDEEFRGRGIAKIIYDYVKSIGFTIRRSSDQTKAGKHFWDKNRGEDSYVWEQTMTQENLDEACWKGYHKEGNKKMFGKTYPNCVKNEDMAEGSTEEATSNAVTFFRGEPILSQERLNQLKSSIGKPYPILRKEGSAANIGTYMSPDGKKATSFVQQALAGQGKGGSVTKILVDPSSFQQGDGGIDEAVIITNIAGLVSSKDSDPNDPLRIKDRKQAMLHYLGPGVHKYLNDPLLSDPRLVKQWYDPEFAESNWNTIKSGKPAVTKPGESEIQERMMRVLGPLAEKIRRDPKVISYFLTHNPGDWVEYNFRMNSDGSGTKVVDVKYYPPAEKQSVTEEKCPHCNGPMFSEELINEKKDACYYKVKSRYKVWPSAYASGALVKCRKKGASNWGNSTKNESAITEGLTLATENLHKWFKEKWVRFGPDGKIRGHCARGGDSEGKPKCLPQAKAHSLGKKGRAKAAARKRRQDPNPERSGKAINVATK